MSVLAAVPVPACASIPALQLQAVARAVKTAHLLVTAHAHHPAATAAPDVLAVLQGVESPVPVVAATAAPGVILAALRLAVETVLASAADVSPRVRDRAREIAIRTATRTAEKAAPVRANQAAPLVVPAVAMDAPINALAPVMVRARAIATAVPDVIPDAPRSVLPVVPKIVAQPVQAVVVRNAADVTAALAAVQAPVPADARVAAAEGVPAAAMARAAAAVAAAPITAPPCATRRALAHATEPAHLAAAPAPPVATAHALAGAAAVPDVARPAIPGVIPRALWSAEATAPAVVEPAAPDVLPVVAPLVAITVQQIVMEPAPRSVLALRQAGIDERRSNMHTITKTLNEEVVSKIESLAFEVEARKSVIAEMLSLNMDVTTDAFSKYQSELVRFKAQFETAKKAIETEYVAPIPGWKNWNLDYATRTLTVQVACGDCCV